MKVTHEIDLVELTAQPAAVVRGHVAAPGLPEFLSAAFADVLRALAEQGLEPAGPPFGRYSPHDDGFAVEAGFPATGAVRPSGRVWGIELPGGTAAQVLHRGDYATVATAYGALEQWLADHGYVHAGRPWESYLDGPDVPEARTVVTIPCQPEDA
jgi:effector-binding domain-containing protein